MAQSSNKLNSTLQKLLLLLLAISSFPLLLERIFSNTNEIEAPAFHILSWAIFMVFVLAFFWLIFSKKSFSQKYFKPLSFLSIVWFTLLVLIFTDRIYGRITSNLATVEKGHVLYPPNTTIHYQSFEMDFKLQINAHGFRRNSAIKKQKGGTRIVCIGDSFTLGWGLDEEDSWPFLLQKSLERKQLELEVLNWGKGGHQPEDYFQVAQEMLPKWKPDILLVSFLQFEDLFQLALGKDLMANNYTQKGADATTQLAYRIFPNIWERINAVHSRDKIDPQWKAQARKIKAQWSKAALDHFETLPDSTQQYFLAGELNPWMMDMNMRFPNWTDSLFNGSFDLEILADIFADKIHGIDSLAQTFGAEVFYQQIPMRGVLSEADRRQLQSVGLDFNLSGAKVFQEKWERLLQERHIYIYDFEDCMISKTQESTSPLFYNLDGHFTTAGNAAYLDCFWANFVSNTGILN